MRRVSMNKGVEILLERMESNPDEFTDGYSATTIVGHKWKDILEKINMRMATIRNEPSAKEYYAHQLDFLSDEDITALHNKLTVIRGEEFTKDIMGRLLGSKAETFTLPQRMQPQTGVKNALAQHQAHIQAELEFQQAQYRSQLGAQNSSGLIGAGVGTGAGMAGDSTWNRVFGKGK